MAKVSAVIAIIGMVYAVAAWGIPLAGLPKRVDAIEVIQPDLLYMGCLTFRDAHPNQLPASCDRAISRGPAR